MTLDVLLGIAAPLIVAFASWVLVARTYKRNPVQVTAVMMAGFAAKMLFFGTYIAVMVKVVGVRPIPFVAAFTTTFIAAYAIEALAMRRLFTHDI
jgi:hypothetical protein